jgi:glutaredoxin
VILVELFSKDDCHLCDVAKDVLINVQTKHPFELREMKLQEGDPRFEEFKERFPVVYINDEFVFQHRVSERMLIEKLQSITGSSART